MEMSVISDSGCEGSKQAQHPGNSWYLGVIWDHVLAPVFLFKMIQISYEFYRLSYTYSKDTILFD